MIDPTGFVYENEHGSWRVVGTRVMMELVVQAYQQGKTPEEIVAAYPSLTVDKVNGVIAFYLSNRELVEKRIEDEHRLFEEELRRQNENPSPVRRRLQALKKARMPEE